MRLSVDRPAAALNKSYLLAPSLFSQGFDVVPESRGGLVFFHLGRKCHAPRFKP